MLPRLALVSIGIRRDLLAPLRFFSKFELAHFYKKNVYGDLNAEDLDTTLAPYASPFDLYQKLVRCKPAVIQGVEPFSYYTQPFVWACVFAARKTRARLLIPTYENRPLSIKFGKLPAALLRAALSAYFKRACLIITHNRGARANVLDCGSFSEKIAPGMWGSWGVDTREFFPGAESSQPPSVRALTILFVGRLHAEKGVFILLDAFARVLKQQPTARLVIAGGGPARRAVESLVRARGMTNSVELRGIIKNRDLPALFRAADVFCAPSITTRKWAEQVGMSALQAMASGVPVVSTLSGAIPEYIPDKLVGILAEENNSIMLARALLELLTDPVRARALGDNARAYALEHYDARTNVRRGEELVMEHCLARRV